MHVFQALCWEKADTAVSTYSILSWKTDNASPSPVCPLHYFLNHYVIVSGSRLAVQRDPLFSLKGAIRILTPEKVMGQITV